MLNQKKSLGPRSLGTRNENHEICGLISMTFSQQGKRENREEILQSGEKSKEVFEGGKKASKALERHVRIKGTYEREGCAKSRAAAQCGGCGRLFSSPAAAAAPAEKLTFPEASLLCRSFRQMISLNSHFTDEEIESQTRQPHRTQSLQVAVHRFHSGIT